MASNLSDADLRSELIRAGLNPGPINAFSRSLWEKKLDKLQKGGGEPASAKKRAAGGLSASRSPGRKAASELTDTEPETETKTNNKVGRGRPRKKASPSPSPVRQPVTRRSPGRGKRPEASDIEDQDEPEDRIPPKSATKSTIPKAGGSRRQTPTKKVSTPATASVIPGELNLSRSNSKQTRAAEQSSLDYSPKKNDSSFLSRFSYTRKTADASKSADSSNFGYSDSDNDESPSRVDISINTSFLPPESSSFSARKSVGSSYGTFSPRGTAMESSTRSSLSYLNGLSRRSINTDNATSYAYEGRNYASSVAQPESRPMPAFHRKSVLEKPVLEPKKSPVTNVFASLQRFRQRAMDKLSWFTMGKPEHLEFEDPQTGGGYFSSRAGAGAGQVPRHMKMRGNYESKVKRPFSINLPAHTSRYLLGALLFFLLILICGYLGSAYKTEAKSALKIVAAAAKDTIDFIYSHMILPILALSFIVGFALAVYWYRKYQLGKEADHQRDVFRMVDRIIAILRKQHIEELKAGRTGDKERCLPIPHIRDMLISPAQRSALFPVWEEAQRYVNENESRVQCETEFVGGQNCMVWRWVQPHGTFDDEKQWQGHAFSDDQVRLNAPVKPYSECLKLRGMFDPEEETEEDWPDHIQDALLEKLGTEIHAMHIAVDRKSKEGCVYMKLGDKQMAGMAFNKLHGSWFDNRLVSVKYLRSERYRERFPEAMRAVFPLEVKKPRHSIP